MGREKHPTKSGNKRKKRKRINGLLAIDLFSANCFFQATKRAKSEEIAQYFADLAADYQTKGFTKVDVFLDKNPTHKTKMQNILATLTTHLTITINFHLMASYSPKLNLVEYAIHLIRQKVLHHADFKTSLEEFEKKIKELCDNQKVVTKQQIINILVHIESLLPDL